MKKKAQKIMTLDDLATIIQGEFLTMQEKMDVGFREVRGNIKTLQGDVTELKSDVAELQVAVTELQVAVTELQAGATMSHAIINRIDMRTQNQVDLIYEENTAMKKDMKTMKQDIISTTTLSQKNKKDIASIKAHVGMKR